MTDVTRWAVEIREMEGGRGEETQSSRGRLSPHGPHGPFRNPGFVGSAGMIEARWGNVVRAIYENEGS